jgi:hypothetical protein
MIIQIDQIDQFDQFDKLNQFDQLHAFSHLDLATLIFFQAIDIAYNVLGNQSF